MFILYPILVAIPLGFLLGGRMERLGTIDVRWGWLALAGLAVQIVLFSGPVVATVGAAGAPLYVGSSLAVLGVVVANLRIPGFGIIAAGAALNVAAILANGGCMPADPAALAAVGEPVTHDATVYSNSCVPDAPVLAPLTDVLAMPTWMPLANVFSIGDVVIGAGVAVAIVIGMRQGGVARATRD